MKKTDSDKKILEAQKQVLQDVMETSIMEGVKLESLLEPIIDVWHNTLGRDEDEDWED